MYLAKRFILFLGGLSLAVSLPGQPATPPAAISSQQAFVTISFTAAVMQTAEAQGEFSALKTRFAPRQTRLQTLSQEVETLRKQLSDDSVRLAEADRTAKGNSFASKEKELQREEEDFRTDSEAASQQAFQKVAQNLYAFLEEYARQHSYSMVVERGSQAAPVVWYASGETDITDAVVRAYNAKPANASSATEQGLKNSSPQTPPQTSTQRQP